MNSKPILTFDTSGINRLADDRDSGALIAGLRAGFHIRLTFLNISEVIANENRERRGQLLEICKRLMSQGDCIDPPHEIIRKMVEHFEASPTFDWRDVPVDFPEAPNVIAREENFSDELADEEREQLRVLDRQFVKVYVDAKPAFDTLFKCSTAEIPLSVADLVARLKMPGGAFWPLASGLYSRVSKLHRTTRPFVGLLIAATHSGR